MNRLVTLGLSAVLVLGACGGDDKKDVAASKRETTTDASTSTSTAAGGTDSTAAGGSAPQAGTTKKSGSGGGSSGGGGGQAAAQPATPAGIKAAAPGTYTYKVTGTRTVGAPTPQKVDSTSTLKVDPLQGTDQHSSEQGDDGGGETVLRYQADGVYLVNLKLTGPITKEFKLAPPGLAFPQPATVGKAWGWSAVSTDGKTTVNSNFKILRTETIQIGGEAVPTVVVETAVTTDGDVKSTSNGTMWVSEAYRLIVREDGKISGTYGGFAFSGDTSSVMQSTKPT